MAPETLARIAARGFKKGDVLGVAQLAGIMGAKRTADLIPLCHPLPLTAVTVELTPQPEQACVVIRATCRVTGRTGVEMEALTAVAVAALTVYDMCKAVDRGMRIERHASRAQGRRPLRRVPGGRLRCCRSPRRRRASWPRSRPMPVEWVALPQALGRVLAGDLAGASATSRRWRSRPWTAMPCARADTAERVGCSASSARRPRVDDEPRRSAPARRCGSSPVAPCRPVPTRSSSRRTPSRRRRRGAVRGRVAPGTFVRPAGLDFAAAGPDSPRAPCSTRARWASPRRWAMSGCRCGDGRGSACSPPATSCAGPARRSKAARSQLEHAHARRRCSRGWGAQCGRSRHLPRRRRGAGRARARCRRPRSAGDHRRRLGRRLRPRPAGARPRGHGAGFLEDRDAAGQAAAVRPPRRRAGAGLSRQSGLDRPSAPSCSCALRCRRMLGLPVGLPLRRGGLANPLPANDQRQDYLRASYVEARSGDAS